MSESNPSGMDELTFQAAMKRLEEVVGSLESDTVDLDTALNKYEEGVGLARHCMQRLNAAELRVRQLTIE